jgi:DNA-binding winged helix-turn-helix (wHTH) protein
LLPPALLERRPWLADNHAIEHFDSSSGAGHGMSPGGMQRVKFDSFELDGANARLMRDGRPLGLAPKAFGVLCALAGNPGQLMTKAALRDAVWGHQHVSASVLKTTISELRAVLADDPKHPRYIETASRFGYRFIAHVHDEGDDGAQDRRLGAGGIHRPAQRHGEGARDQRAR